MTYDKKYYSGTYFPSSLYRWTVYTSFQMLYYLFYGVEIVTEQFSSVSHTSSYAMRSIRQIFYLFRDLLEPTLKSIRQPFLSILTRPSRRDRQYIDFGHPERPQNGIWSGTSYIAPKQVMMYIHGGGYVSGDIAGFLPIADKIATILKCPVFLPEYSLVPEHTVSDAVDDLIYALEHVCDTYPNIPVCVCGDSAGGGLTFLMLNEWYRQKGSCNPIYKCAVWSPMIDLPTTGQSLWTNAERDRCLNLEIVQYCSKLASQPSISTWNLNWNVFPHTRIVVCDDEILLSDSLQANKLLKQATLEIYTESFHGFHLFWEYIPEAEQELFKLKDFLTH